MRNRILSLCGAALLSTLLPSNVALAASRTDLIPGLLVTGRACGTPEPDAARTRELLFGEPTDCSFSATSIESQYDPIQGKIIVPTVVHIIHEVDGTGNLTDELVESQIDLGSMPAFADVRRAPDTWQRVFDMIRTRQMPPEDADPLSDGDRQTVRVRVAGMSP